MIWAYKAHGLTRKEIAETMGVKPKYVAVYEKRIKEKVSILAEQGIILDGSPAEILFENQIEEIFEAAQLKNLPRKTVKQAQFLQDSSAHAINKKESDTQRRMRSRLGIRRKQDALIFTRQCTPEELDSFEKVEQNSIPASVMKLKWKYDYCLATGEGTIEELASLELILRSYGIILITPHINKLNAKTGLCQRAMVEDTVIVLKDGEKIDYPNPKFVEKTTNEDGEVERVYIIEGKYNSKRRREQ